MIVIEDLNQCQTILSFDNKQMAKHLGITEKSYLRIVSGELQITEYQQIRFQKVLIRLLRNQELLIKRQIERLL